MTLWLALIVAGLCLLALGYWAGHADGWHAGAAEAERIERQERALCRILRRHEIRPSPITLRFQAVDDDLAATILIHESLHRSPDHP